MPTIGLATAKPGKSQGSGSTDRVKRPTSTLCRSPRKHRHVDFGVWLSGRPASLRMINHKRNPSITKQQKSEKVNRGTHFKVFFEFGHRRMHSSENKVALVLSLEARARSNERKGDERGHFE